MRKEDLTQHFVDSVKRRIFGQVYRVGDSLPSHRQLAEEFGCSRSVINVGIARLVSEGYLAVRTRQRTLVNSFLTAPSLTVLRDMAFSEDAGYRRRAVTDILAARKLIELEAVRLAAETGAPTKRLDGIIASELAFIDAGGGDYKTAAQLDYAFHTQIIDMSPNLVYSSVMSVFSLLAREMTEVFYKSRPDLFGFYVEAHKRIAAAVQQKNAAEACSALAEILEHGEKAYQILNQ